MAYDTVKKYLVSILVLPRIDCSNVQKVASLVQESGIQMVAHVFRGLTYYSPDGPVIVVPSFAGDLVMVSIQHLPML
jgi:hypothetical protein